jgi:hypothetical protein
MIRHNTFPVISNQKKRPSGPFFGIMATVCQETLVPVCRGEITPLMTDVAVPTMELATFKRMPAIRIPTLANNTGIPIEGINRRTPTTFLSTLGCCIC